MQLELFCSVCSLWFCDDPKCKSLAKLQNWIAENPEKRQASKREYDRKTDRRAYFKTYYRNKKKA